MKSSTAFLATVFCVALAWGDPPPAAPASKPAAEEKGLPPPADKATVARYVEQLGSQSYRLRKEARDELRKLLNSPGAVEEIHARLKDTRDSEVRLVLEGLLETYRQPLAMVWCRGAMQTYAGNKQYMRLDPGFPWLLICGDGTFYYDASSPLFTGKPGELMDTDFRQGQLTVAQIHRLTAAIDASGVSKLPPGNPLQATNDPARIETHFYTRSGNTKRSGMETWAVDAFAPGRKPASPASTEALVVAIREVILSAESKPYEGLYRAFARYEPVRDRTQVAKLPDWPVAGTDIPHMMQQGGVELDAKQLKEAREALKKTQVFKYATSASCRVWLIPHVPAARELYYGSTR